MYKKDRFPLKNMYIFINCKVCLFIADRMFETG